MPACATPPGGETAAERDARLSRLGRQWFAEVRAREAQERRADAAADRRARRASRDRSGDADGPWDWLLGGGEGDGDGGAE